MLGLNDLADTLIHKIEATKGTKGPIGNAFGNILKDTQHGTFTNRCMLAGEGIVAGQCLDGRFKEVVLILRKGVGVAKLLLSTGDAVSAGAVHKFEEGLEVRLFLGVKGGKVRSY